MHAQDSRFSLLLPLSLLAGCGGAPEDLDAAALTQELDLSPATPPKAELEKSAKVLGGTLTSNTLEITKSSGPETSDAPVGTIDPDDVSVSLISKAPPTETSDEIPGSLDGIGIETTGDPPPTAPDAPDEPGGGPYGTTSSGLTAEQMDRAVSEEPGRFVALSGRQCLVNQSPSGDGFAVETSSEELPPWASRSTIVLNGWFAHYLGQNVDHEVAALQVQLHEIRRSGDDLVWKATTRLVDQNRDDPFEVCYDYLVLGWESSLGLGVQHNDAPEHSSQYHYYQGGLTQRRSTQAFATLPAQRRWLPRGFSFRWNDINEDHHLFEVLYDTAGHRIGSGYYDYPDTTFEDDSLTRVFWMDEWVSVLGGNDLHIIDGTNNLYPHLPPSGNGCITGDQTTDGAVMHSPSVKITEYTETNLPYRHALPVLSGWDIYFPCGDEHIAGMSARLHDAHYAYDAAQGMGTLTYRITTALYDKDERPGHRGQVRVDILGID